MGRKFESIGTKSIGFKNISTTLQLLPMDVLNHFWIADIQFIETAIYEYTFRVQHGAHRAVTD